MYTASDMTDYTANSTTLKFVAGSELGTRGCLEVAIKADTTAESEETFQVVASVSSNTVNIAPLTSATVRITETKTVVPSPSITGGGVNVNSNGNSTSPSGGQGGVRNGSDPSGGQGGVRNGSEPPVTCTFSIILLLTMTCVLTLA